MCGIGGFFVSPESDLLIGNNISKLEKFTVELLKNLEDRGKEASGLAITRSDGVKVFKQAVKSSELVESAHFKGFIKANLTFKTISVMVHTRIPTCGGTSNNDNNHPVIHGNVVGVHNGHITNHADLFSKLRVKRLAEVDSEAIFALLNLAWDHEIKAANFKDIDYSDALVKTAPALEGMYAYAAVNARFPERLGLVRGGSNCVMVQKLRREKDKMISFATTLSPLEKAGNSAGLWDVLKTEEYDYLTDKAALSIKVNDKNEIDIWERKTGG